METTISIAEFWNKNNLGSSIEVKQSSKTYQGTVTPILYIVLPHEVDGQDHLVLSKRLAERLILDHDSLLEAGVVRKDADWGWGLISQIITFATYRID